MTKLIFTSLVFLLLCSHSFAQQITDHNDIPFIANSDHPVTRMRYKQVYSTLNPKENLIRPFTNEINTINEAEYERLKLLILDKDIPALQQSIKRGELTYKKLTLFYLYRIWKYETDTTKALNSIIALNPQALVEAEKRDKQSKTNKSKHPLYGMPILLKDNIGFEGLPTTAGAAVLEENKAKNAFITQKLIDKGAIILGKANLSEWAYYFCSGCPLGYSAMGGQSMNPYGRMKFESGGSSAGSGTAIAAQYAVAAVGSETSGSILSPSSLNSLVGLKPSIGILSRMGIVPISSTLDTPGPMTKSVIDNAILMDAMYGFDSHDPKSINNKMVKSYLNNLKLEKLTGKRIGIFSTLRDLENFKILAQKLEKAGAKVIYIDKPSPNLPGFLSILNLDMKEDLEEYLASHASAEIKVKGIKDILSYNKQNIKERAPYGQGIFENILKDTTSAQGLKNIKQALKKTARSFFDQILSENKLDVIISMNNTHAAVAAVAEYPCLTVPVGYKVDGEPQGATLILPSLQEKKLYTFGLAIEQMMKARKSPKNYN